MCTGYIFINWGQINRNESFSDTVCATRVARACNSFVRTFSSRFTRSFVHPYIRMLIDHIRILGIRLELACNGDSCE